MTLLGVVGTDEGARRQPSQPPRPEAERIDPGEHHAQRGVEGDGEERGNGHRQVLREGEGLEEAPLLVDEGEHGQESDGDDQEREEDRWTDLHQGLQAYLMKAPLATTDLPVVDLVVGVFDLDDRSIHEDADRDGDSCERHDVDRQAHEVHGMKASSTEIGMVRMGTTAEGTCQRKKRITNETMIISTTSSCFSVPIARSISVERS
jgi:hypothetical protein